MIQLKLSQLLLCRPDLLSSFFHAACEPAFISVVGAYRLLAPSLSSCSYLRVPLPHGMKDIQWWFFFKLSFLNYFKKKEIYWLDLLSQKMFLEIILFINISHADDQLIFVYKCWPIIVFFQYRSCLPNDHFSGFKRY